MKQRNGLELTEITSLKDSVSVNEFIRVPWLIYRDDPAWVPPLLIERRMHLAPYNPYFHHARCSFWVVRRNGRAVGRISAQVDRLHLKRYGDSTGFWGMLEAEDNREIFELLLSAAEEWLRSMGMKRALGPFNLSINQECGLLVEGFDTPPSMMMGHARQWYSDHVEACGYRKAKDLLAYTLDMNESQPPGIRKITETRL